MVTDFTKFNPGAPPSKGFFHVLNQLPGHVVTKDMTDRISSDLYVIPPPSFGSRANVKALLLYVLPRGLGSGTDFLALIGGVMACAPNSCAPHCP
jgi:hypothetical protein